MALWEGTHAYAYLAHILQVNILSCNDYEWLTQKACSSMISQVPLG